MALGDGVPVDLDDPGATAVETRTGRRGIVWFGLFVAGLSMAIMWPGLTGGFVFDDWGYLNETQQGDWWRSSITDVTNPIFRPVLLGFIELQHTLFGSRPLPFHLVAFLLLLVCGVLMYRLTLRLHVDEWGARIAGAVIVLHAAMVWPIAWTSAVSSLLALALSLGVCLLLAEPEPSIRAAVAAVALFLIAIFTREVVAGLPLVVVLLRLTLLPGPLARRVVRAARPTLGLWAVLVAYGLLRIISGAGSDGGAYEVRLGGQAVLNLLTLMKIASNAPSLPFSRSQRILAVAIWVVLVVLVIVAARAGRTQGVAGLAWFLIGVAPVVPLFRQLMVPYYLDFALPGLALVVGVAFAEIARRIPGRWATAMGLVAVISLAGLSLSLAEDSLGPLTSKAARAERLEAQIRRAYPDPPEGSTIVVQDVDGASALVTVDGDMFRVIYDDPSLQVVFRPTD